MSTYWTYEATCLCGHTWPVRLIRGVHITRLPEVRQAVLDRALHVFACPRCAVRITIEAPFVYTDFDRMHYVAVETPVGRSEAAARLQHQTVFDDSFAKGPPVAQALGQRMRHRLVFGLEALREKLVVWDAGLDEMVIEATKGDVLAARGLAPAHWTLRIERVEPGGDLVTSLAPRGADAAPEAGLIAAAQWQRRDRDRAAIRTNYPWLDDPWIVDIGAAAGAAYG